MEVTRRDNTDFTDAIKRSCRACVVINSADSADLSSKMNKKNSFFSSMQQQGVEQKPESIGSIRLCKKQNFTFYHFLYHKTKVKFDQS